MEDGVLEQTRRPPVRRGLGRGLEAILPARGVPLARHPSEGPDKPGDTPGDKTGLLGRLDDALGASRLEGSSVAVIVFGLDGFRHVNARYGYAVGDAVLEDVAARVRRARRSEDTVARLRGDEFVVVCRRADGGGARIVARLAQEIERPLDVGGVVHRLRATVGVVVTETGGGEHPARTLLDEADLAMQRAKDEGRPWVVVDRSTPHPEPSSPLSVEAVRPGEGSGERSATAAPRYRPIAMLRSRLVTGALLSVTAGDLAVARVADDIEGWRRTADLPGGFRVWLDLRVAPAPSGAALRGPGAAQVVALASLLGDAVAAGAVSAEALGVVVPAWAAADAVHGPALPPLLGRLAGSGVGLAVDAADLVAAAQTDLLSLPLGALWLPDGLVGTPGVTRTVLARNLAAVGGDLGLDVVAAGADDDDSASTLGAIGCTHATGALFGRPVSAERFAGLLWVSAGAHQVPRWNTSPTGRLGRLADVEGVSSSAGWPRSTAPT